MDVTAGKSARRFETVAGYSGDKFCITLDNQLLDNRGVAGEMIFRRAVKILLRFGDDVRLGTFAGYYLFLRSSNNNSAELMLRGKTVTTALKDMSE